MKYVLQGTPGELKQIMEIGITFSDAKGILLDNVRYLFCEKTT